MNINNYIDNFRASMNENGILYHGEIIADGELHRIHIDGDKPGSKNGWFVLHANNIPAGCFGSWKLGAQYTWCSRDKSQMSEMERTQFDNFIKQVSEKRLQKKEEAHAQAKNKAIKIWSASQKASDEHPYLIKKHVKAYNIRDDAYGKLIIPLFDIDKNLCSLQFIHPNGEKRFLKDGCIKGNFHTIGEQTETIYIVEGYATGATVYEATNCETIVAFNGKNLLPIAKGIRLKYPDKKLILIADNDQWTENNPGVTNATEAAEAIGAILIVPDFTNMDTKSDPTDFNDMMLIAGLDEVKRQIERAFIIKREEVIPEEEVIEHLASLTLYQYGVSRNELQEKLKIPLKYLDQLHTKAQKEEVIENAAPFPVIEPWHEPVDGISLLHSLSRTIRRFVILGEHESNSVALWILFTYCIDARDVAPILSISSPEKRCGKSTLLSLITMLVNKPLSTSNISPAALFRVAEKWKPTLLIDEVDTFISDERSELRGIINSGHTKQLAFVIRTTGEDHEPKLFSTWCAKCLAGIGNLPDTIKDRSIIISLRRKLTNEQVQKLRDADEGIFINLQKKCARFAHDNMELIRSFKPPSLRELNDRAFDNWTPLFAIASVSGGEWLEFAQKSATYLSGTHCEAPTVGIELLKDIKEVFDSKNINYLTSVELLEALCEDKEAPWATWLDRTKCMSPRQLAEMLRSFDINSKNKRYPSGKVLKTYEREDFQDAFQRYLTSDTVRQGPKNAATSATPLQSSPGAVFEENLSATASATHFYALQNCSV